MKTNMPSGRNNGIPRRKFIETSAFAGAALVLGPELWAAEGTAPFREAPLARIGNGSRCVLRFAHITDTHYYAIDDAAPNAAAFETYMKSRVGWHTEEPAANIYAELQRRHAEFAVHTGDIIDYFTDENLGYLDRMTADIQFPVHCCLGNHDYSTLNVDSDAKALWGFVDDFAVTIEAWKKKVRIFTDRNYTFVRSGYRFIFLDNALKKFDAGQLAWLDTQLAAADTPCILAFHIPLYSKQMAEAVKNADLLMPPEGDIYDVLARHDNVAAIFAGHVHRSTVSDISGIPQFTTGSTYHRAFRMVECYA